MGSEFGVTPATKPHARLDAVGLFFIALASGWTLILVCAMVFLYLKREMPFLRIRGLPLSFAGIAFLHLYWCSVQIGYAIGPLAPPYAEYFIMGLWLPIGIGLFQASNSQLLHVAKMQKVYIRRGSIDEDSIRNRKLSRWSIIRKFQLADYAKKMFVYVTIGVIFQVSFVDLRGIIAMLTSSDLSHLLHVPDLSKVPPQLRHSGYAAKRYPNGTEG